ncbi:polyphosphate kinase 2 family protein [Halalkalibacter alkalisediminis]|uniref:Polyphosphate kinase 2 family protein n=1 Tax=Halalkalibacter alkalisediminis TaxID=935616 RepID=A0ABV6NDG0_9BACI|nr:UDP-galactose-lipid carrier transferase [Halalkalibacter alkalisediminis]
MLQSNNESPRFTSKKHYKKTLKMKQLQLIRLQRKLYEQNIPVILIFEGWDAAGKGGTIKRITERLDPRGYSVHGISAPDKHELNYHYMRRFWKVLPKKGEICIFDRSWYGRVLVERVESLATIEEWTRAYDEINHTEKMLADDGHIIIKFWLDISKEEQLSRFKARESDPFKSWKLTDEDWRNREKWDLYEEAVEQLINQTNSASAKWHIINSNDKQSARIAVLDKLIEEFEKQVGEID